MLLPSVSFGKNVRNIVESLAYRESIRKSAGEIVGRRCS